MTIVGIELFLLELPLTEPFVASHGTTSLRTISIAKVITEHGVGWGECSALPAATYTAESAAGSFRSMAEDLAPRLIGRELGLDLDGELDGESGRQMDSQVDGQIGGGVLDTGDEPPMARSCLEMAVLDAALKASNMSLAAWLFATSRCAEEGGGPPPSVAAGVSLGLDTVDRTVTRAVDLAASGYGRLKVKVEPGHDRQLVAAIRTELPEVELHIDANGAYVATDGIGEIVDDVLSVAQLGVDAVEQPFSTSDKASAAELIAKLDRSGSNILVVADEAVERHEQAIDLLAARAMTGLSIKPGRLGGLTVARDLHDLCCEYNVAATAGGMLETGLGRHALVALATLPGFTMTGDLSPASRWLAADPWSDLMMAGGEIHVPMGPGVAPEPDLEVLDRFTVSQIGVR